MRGQPKSVLPLLLLLTFIAASARADVNLTLNKTHKPGTIAVGAPITYVITLSNSGTPNNHVSVTDTLPSGFVFVSATCAATLGATCPTGTLQPPTFGEFSIPTNGNITIEMTGYFKTIGSQINTAVASAKDDQGNPVPVGNTNTSQDSVFVPSDPLPVDLKIEKCIGPSSACVGSSSAVFPANLHYAVTVTNNTLQDVYLGGLLTVRDVLNSSGVQVTFTTSNYSCAPAALCPDMPAPASGSNGMTITFSYDASGASSTNDSGFLPGGGSYKIEFDVNATTTATCKTGGVAITNRAFLNASNSTQNLNDQNTTNNTSAQINTSITGGLPPDCPPPPPSVQVSKVQTNPAGNTGSWNGPVTYRVKITNPTAGTLTNFPLTDRIYKVTGTPTFTATVTSGPSCVSGCSSLTSVNPLNPTVNLDFFFFNLWTALLPTLGPGQEAVIDYTVTYAPVCETDNRPDQIVNQFQGGSAFSQTHTNLPEAGLCQLDVKKTKLTTGPVVFGTPFQYEVVFSNLSATSLAVGAVRDVLSIASNRYGTFTFNYSVSCQVTAGTIVSLTPPTTGTITPFPGSKSATGTVSYRPFGWQGTRLIDEALSFGPNSTLTCGVDVTANQPTDANPFCQGADNPQLINSAYMDLSRNYNDNDSHQPSFYSSQATALPLCRNLIVTKTADMHNFGPGATVVYTITVENKGDDPVDFFTLTDVIQPPLIPGAVTPCTPANCTAGPTLSGNQVSVAYGLLQPGVPVSFDLTVTAPQAGGSYPNLAQGSFLPGGNFYFQGDVMNFLQQEENIQVVTPTLAKSFGLGTIGPNGTATLVFTITNTNGDPPQTGISFSDTLSPGLLADHVVSNGCGGTASITLDARTIQLAAGQLGSGSHSCQVVVAVKATGICGLLTNDSSNFSNVANLDVSSVNEHLEVAGCPLACVGATPSYEDPLYTSTFTAQVAIATCFADQPSDPVLVVIDLKNQAGAPLDTSWDASSNPPTAFYHAANWTKANLGNVFGLALDNGGNIYLTATSSYFFDAFPPAGPGAVYRVAAGSGAITTFATLPNMGAGLGNIHYDAGYDSFYVTNFDDGLVRRLDHPLGTGAATVLGQWDHGANLPSATPPDVAIPDDLSQSFTPLGRRIWGVHTFSGRLYYSVWWDDEGTKDPLYDNEIWSVALDATGNFVAGTARLEVTLPPLPGEVYSNPVADINFGPSGNMLLAERSMGDLTTPSAHQSRGLEYVLSGGAWIPSPNLFEVSQLYPPGSAAGGVDQDFAPGGRVWFSGDALHLSSPDNIYGLQGLPAIGGDTSDSILIDLDDETTLQDKTEIGDVAISCPSGSEPSPDIDVSLFTGWDETSGTRLPRGTADDDWTVAVGDGPAQPALLVTGPPAAWPRFRTSEWISATASGASHPGGLTERFERCFCIAADATNAKLMLRLRADDVATVSLNGVQIGGPGGQFRRAQPLRVLYMGPVGNSLFQHGTNCVAVTVADIRQRFIGLDVAGSVWLDRGRCAGASY